MLAVRTSLQSHELLRIFASFLVIQVLNIDVDSGALSYVDFDMSDRAGKIEMTSTRDSNGRDQSSRSTKS